ncbi:uncharacterized protein PHALS_14542 [Plasmopara halstedii]|uniref:Uncharacterized protein n=1 Tax=Plasmopara halstedii TaxID=4781 RepID=A0A0P1AK03_PLAHL|nr:uncharacterized protein PHALS_14542 [Plasmopara halstedii]CEG41566.1 hypothetical protein PHALS_14542 [Plasmopara halstedii]|eukprot:XP_024577935.1 hypothetical protein PHALS_14542 [Plasmopara halstedii]
MSSWNESPLNSLLQKIVTTSTPALEFQPQGAELVYTMNGDPLNFINERTFLVSRSQRASTTLRDGKKLSLSHEF